MHTVRWFAAHTQPRHEKKVRAHLQSRNIETFLPVYLAPRRWNNGLKVNLELPLFPGYLFVRTSLHSRVPVLNTPGVVGLVGSGPRPIPVPDDDIELLTTRVTQLKPEPHPYIEIGDRVRVRSGPLSGCQGILLEKKDGLRFIVSMDLLMQSVSVQIEAADIEHLPARRGLCV
jgi:transcription antitermination factor NusG